MTGCPAGLPQGVRYSEGERSFLTIKLVETWCTSIPGRQFNSPNLCYDRTTGIPVDVPIPPVFPADVIEKVNLEFFKFNLGYYWCNKGDGTLRTGSATEWIGDPYDGYCAEQEVSGAAKTNGGTYLRAVLPTTYPQNVIDYTVGSTKKICSQLGGLCGLPKSLPTTASPSSSAPPGPTVPTVPITQGPPVPSLPCTVPVNIANSQWSLTLNSGAPANVLANPIQIEFPVDNGSLTGDTAAASTFDGFAQPAFSTNGTIDNTCAANMTISAYTGSVHLGEFTLTGSLNIEPLGGNKITGSYQLHALIGDPATYSGSFTLTRGQQL